jgi:hypothetical protein
VAELAHVLPARVSRAETVGTDDGGAVVAILRYWRENPQSEWWLIADSSTRSLGGAEVEVLHPDQPFLDGGNPDPSQAPNSYSTPLLIEWERVRVVLGADLPTPQWGRILGVGRGTPLAVHAALKASHHDSVNAQIDELIDAGDAASAVVMTPWNLGRRPLPRLEARGGVDWFLQRREGVALTAPGRGLTGVLPQPVKLSRLAASIERRQLPGSGTMEIRHDYNPDESWVAFSFDQGGGLAAARFGREARRVEA